MRPVLIALVSTTVALAGCAKKTQDISASYVSATRYDNFLCSQLREEATRVSNRTAAVFAEQNAKASVAAVTYWPTSLFSKGAGASDDEVARLKGEMGAIEQASAARNCGVQFRGAGATANSGVAPRYDGGPRYADTRTGAVGRSIYNAPRVSTQQ